MVLARATGVVLVTNSLSRQSTSRTPHTTGKKVLYRCSCRISHLLDFSADELFQKAFGTSPPSTSSFDWSAVQDLSDEDQMAMNEIEDAMREEWMRNYEKEAEDISDEAEEFFGQ